MVEYAAGQDRGQLLDLTSHCMHANRFEVPRHLVEEVAAVLRLGQVHNPSNTRPPPDTSEEGLSAWPCCEHLDHLLGLIHLPQSVCVLADYHVGKYVDYLAGGTGLQAASAVIGRLCMEANLCETWHYLGLLRECACFDCSSDLEWIRERSTSPRPGP
jgi:hypothetical protein